MFNAAEMVVELTRLGVLAVTIAIPPAPVAGPVRNSGSKALVLTCNNSRSKVKALNFAHT